VIVAACLLATLLPGRALALGSDHPADRPISAQPEWPAGLHGLLSHAGRVHGYFVNANDYFFYAGDAKALNEAIKAYAALKDTPLTLVLHPGKGAARSPWSKEKPRDCDWKINVYRRGWHPEAPVIPGVAKAGYVVSVEVWIDGQVKLDKLVVPHKIQLRTDKLDKADERIKKFLATFATQERGT
jgi:hypothetical protein